MNFTEAKIKMPSFPRRPSTPVEIPLRNIRRPSLERTSASPSSSSSPNLEASSSDHQSAAAHLNILPQVPAQRNVFANPKVTTFIKNTAIGVAATGGVASIIGSLKKNRPSEEDVQQYIDHTIERTRDSVL